MDAEDKVWGLHWQPLGYEYLAKAALKPRLRFAAQGAGKAPAVSQA